MPVPPGRNTVLIAPQFLDEEDVGPHGVGADLLCGRRTEWIAITQVIFSGILGILHLSLHAINRIKLKLNLHGGDQTPVERMEQEVSIGEVGVSMSGSFKWVRRTRPTIGWN